MPTVERRKKIVSPRQRKMIRATNFLGHCVMIQHSVKPQKLIVAVLTITLPSLTRLKILISLIFARFEIHKITALSKNALNLCTSMKLNV